jgi:hypothetical protein
VRGCVCVSVYWCVCVCVCVCVCAFGCICMSVSSHMYLYAYTRVDICTPYHTLTSHYMTYHMIYHTFNQSNNK